MRFQVPAAGPGILRSQMAMFRQLRTPRCRRGPFAASNMFIETRHADGVGTKGVRIRVHMSITNLAALPPVILLSNQQSVVSEFTGDPRLLRVYGS